MADVPSSFINLLCLWLFLFFLLVFFDGSLIFLFLNWLLNSLSAGSPQVNVEVDELGVLLDKVPDSILLQEVIRFFLEMQRNGGSSLQGVSSGILHNSVGIGVRLPDVLLVVVILGGHHHLVSNQES